jgi:hypothetical protein
VARQMTVEASKEMFRSQLTRSAGSVAEAAAPAEPADTSARGRGRGAPTGRKRASEARIFSSWRWWRTPIARRRAVSAHPERAGTGPRSAVIAITSSSYAAWLSGLASWVGRPCAAAMSRRWRTGGYLAQSPADPVTSGSMAGRRGWHTPLPAHARPGEPSPATAAEPSSAAAGEEAIADRRETGPEDQSRSQHQQVGRRHPAGPPDAKP